MTDVSTPARSERAALCDLLIEVGPDAPTLCGDWTTRDLAAHLVVRERRPDAALGLVVSAFARHGEKVRADAARQPYADLVQRVRSGPPKLSPTRLGPIDALTNTVEFFVHHEDVRRAGGEWSARSLSPALDSALRGALARMGSLMAKSSPCGLVIEPSGGDAKVAKKGEPSVTLRGPVGEIVLFLFGRQPHSLAEVDGPADLVEAVRTARFGV